MSKKYPKQLSERDLKVAIWIAEQGAVRLHTINDFLEIHYKKIDPRQLRALAARLVKHVLANKERIFAGSAIVWATSEGLKLAGFKLTKGERVRKPSLAQLLHTLNVSEIRLVYERHGAEWVCERTLRSEFIEHLPDGMAILKGTKILIEVDRTRKESQRHFEIMLSNLNSGTYIVDYWIAPELLTFAEKQRQSLPEKLQERVRIFDLSIEVSL
jgi:hypothetical protein